MQTMITCASGGVNDVSPFLCAASRGGVGSVVSSGPRGAQLPGDVGVPPLSLAVPPGQARHLWCASGVGTAQGSAEAHRGLRAFAVDAGSLARCWLGGSAERAAQQVQEALGCLGAAPQQPPGVLLVGSAALLCPVGDMGAGQGALLAARRLLQGAAQAHPLPAPLTEAQCACLHAFLRLLALGLGAALAALPPCSGSSGGGSAQQDVLRLLQGAQPPPAPVLSPPDRTLLPHSQDTLALALAALPPGDAAWGQALAAAPAAAWPAALRSAPVPPSFLATASRLAPSAKDALVRPSAAWARDAALSCTALLGAQGRRGWEAWAGALVAGSSSGLGSSSSSSSGSGTGSGTAGRAGVSGARLSIGPRASMGGRRSLGGGGSSSSSSTTEGDAASISSSRRSSVSSISSATEPAVPSAAPPPPSAPAGAAAKDPKKFFSLLAAGAGKPPSRAARPPEARQ